MTISISQRDIELKKTFRSLIIYESAMGKAFNPTTVTETIMYFYCVVIASDPTLEITFDDFMDWLDDKPTALQEFTEWLLRVAEQEQSTQQKKTSQRRRKQA